MLQAVSFPLPARAELPTSYHGHNNSRPWPTTIQPSPIPGVSKTESPRPPLSPHALGFENGGRSCPCLELEWPCHGVAAKEKGHDLLAILCSSEHVWAWPLLFSTPIMWEWFVRRLSRAAARAGRSRRGTRGTSARPAARATAPPPTHPTVCPSTSLPPRCRPPGRRQPHRRAHPSVTPPQVGRLPRSPPCPTWSRCLVAAGAKPHRHRSTLRPAAASIGRVGTSRLLHW